MSYNIPKTMKAAIDQYSLRLRNALKIFRASDDPLWRRTQDGIAMFQGLQLTDLPPRLIADVDRRFAAINAILDPYELTQDDGYQPLSTNDLVTIQDLIEGFAFDP